jgi:hypothetical protein
VHGQVRSTDELAGTEAAQPEQTLGSAHVTGLTAVGRADQSDVAVGQSKALHAAGLEQWQSLERLCRGSEENLKRRIAASGHEPSILIDYGRVRPVPGLDLAAPADSSDDRG